MIVCGLLSVMICIAVRDPIIKKGRVGISLISVSLPHVCACLKQGLRFQTSYVGVFFMSNDLRCEMVVRLVDIVVDIGHSR